VPADKSEGTHPHINTRIKKPTIFGGFFYAELLWINNPGQNPLQPFPSGY
jgi:hypothetical protein